MLARPAFIVKAEMDGKKKNKALRQRMRLVDIMVRE
jgi:hypothetical protein